jgi:hypothetical protein
MKYWEITAKNLSKRGWSWGCSKQRDQAGHTVFAVDAYRATETGLSLGQMKS